MIDRDLKEVTCVNDVTLVDGELISFVIWDTSDTNILRPSQLGHYMLLREPAELDVTGRKVQVLVYASKGSKHAKPEQQLDLVLARVILVKS